MKTNSKKASSKWQVASGLKILSILLIGGIGFPFAHEFSIYGGGGLHTLMYDIKDSDKSHGLGNLVGFGYTYFFTPKWGLGSGIEIALYKASYEIDTYNQRYMTTDHEGNEIEFRSKISGYKEEQSAMLLQIPVMLQYLSNKTGNKAFYYALGGKIGIPITGASETSATSITNTGYREFENYEYKTQEFLGFGTFNGKRKEEKLSLNTAFLLSTEAGMRWKLSDALRLYTGVYFDYGLNSISKEKASDRIVEYNGEERTFSLNNLVDETVPLTIGLKLKLSFDAGAVAAEEARRKAAKEIAQLTEETRRKTAEETLLAVEEEARRKAAEEEAARLAALEEAKRKAAEKEVARLAAIETGKADILQAKIDAIQNQVLNDFRITQTKPDARQIPALDQIIDLLKDHPELRFYLNGHTCDKGDKEVNRHVGYERAKAVKDYIISKGIDESHILGIGSKLYYEPLVPNTSEENRRKNRRVEFVIEKWLPVVDEGH